MLDKGRGEDKIEKEIDRYERAIVELWEVDLKYDGGERYGLKNINVSIYEGEKIGVVGKSGGGK
ncbi:hypothetical protein [Staphylococcus saprophyticus]|uniref:hypothetical protein n=1 Tax=Staphylococcus saprophyticus TaxID=29385 RepID=UPI0011AA72BC|nr:hypothetical protein [Staphylococcus saprophyticus]